MSTPFTFQTSQFGISLDSIHLLRNGFSYRTIPISSIQSIDIKTAKDIKNWWWVFTIGLLLVGFAIWDIGQIFGILTDESTYKVYAERLVIPAIPFMLGAYSIIIALRNTSIMIIKANDKSHYLSLRDLVKQKQLDAFLTHLQSQYSGVNIIYPN
jgi:hypothetical protein